MRDILLARRRTEALDQWAILGRFDGDRRARTRWHAASGLMLDLDYEDPGVPRDEGSHQPVPDQLRDRLSRALLGYTVSGLAYLTRRGFRWACVLAEEVTEVDAYGEIAQLAAQRLLKYLAECGIPLWRDGACGFRYDGASAKPEQPMRLPLTNSLVLLTGRDCPIEPTDLREDLPQLDLDAALPPEFAEACRQIGCWVQIAPEVVVTGLMALSAAATGNTRWIVVRGLTVPLSLQYVTVQPPGSGKSTVRGFLRRAADRIEKDVASRRAEAEKELQDSAVAIEEWRADRRSTKTRDKAGPRPEPASLTPKGGARTSFIVSEGTLEGIIATLEDTPRGFLWASDEAHEVLGLLGCYGDSGGKRSLDAARLRRLMQSEPVEAHRARSNNSPVRRLPRPNLSIDVDVQPGVFATLFTDEDRVSGMTARFLIHAPPSMHGRRRYVNPPPEPESRVLEVLRAHLTTLWELELTLKDGVPQYEALNLSPEAEKLWAEELECLEQRYVGADDEEAGALGHARGRILRLAGNLALMRKPQTRVVVEEDMRRALVHMRYHLDQHRRFVLDTKDGGRAERLDALRERVERIYLSQQSLGVRPSDLRHRVNQKRYAGEAGNRKALADLHGLGWILRRPTSAQGRPGRKPVPAFFPPEGGAPSAISAKPSPRGGVADLADCISSPDVREWPDARLLLDRASGILLARGEVTLPPTGDRVACPACGSPDGRGTLPDDPTRWYCHSDRHAGKRSGCAVDLLLAERLGRMPTTAESVKEARLALARPEQAGAARECAAPDRRKTPGHDREDCDV